MLDLSDIQLKVQLVLGGTKISIKDIERLKAGDVIMADEYVGSPITMLINGKPVAYGELISRNEKYGFKITKIWDEFEKEFDF